MRVATRERGETREQRRRRQLARWERATERREQHGRLEHDPDGPIPASSEHGVGALRDYLSRRRSGKAAPQTVRHAVERALGAGLPSVHIHDDDAAAHITAALNARAVTVGTDILLGVGERDLASPRGFQLLSHELAHVAEQPTRIAPMAPLTLGAAGATQERAADSVASRAAFGGRAPVATMVASAPGTIRAKGKNEPSTDQSAAKKPETASADENTAPIAKDTGLDDGGIVDTGESPDQALGGEQIANAQSWYESGGRGSQLAPHLPAISTALGLPEKTALDAELIEAIARFQRTHSPDGQRGVDGKIGEKTLALLKTHGGLKLDGVKAGEMDPSGKGGLDATKVWPTEGASEGDKFDHYAALLSKSGATDIDAATADRPILVGLRGIKKGADKTHRTRADRKYDDTYVLIWKDGDQKRVWEFSGATYPYQAGNNKYGGVAMIKGDTSYDVSTIGNANYYGYKAPHVKHRSAPGKAASGNVPAYRQKDGDGYYAAKGEKKQTTANAILFHPGYDTWRRTKRSKFSSIGCQTATGTDIERLTRIGFSYDERPQAKKDKARKGFDYVLLNGETAVEAANAAAAEKDQPPPPAKQSSGAEQADEKQAAAMKPKVEALAKADEQEVALDLTEKILTAVTMTETNGKAVESRLNTSAGLKASYKSKVQATAPWAVTNLKKHESLREQAGLTLKDLNAGEGRMIQGGKVWDAVMRSGETSAADFAKSNAKALEAAGLSQGQVNKMMAFRDFRTAVRAGKGTDTLEKLGTAAGLDATSVNAYSRRSKAGRPIWGEDRSAWQRAALESDARVGGAVQQITEHDGGMTMGRAVIGAHVASYTKAHPRATAEQVLRYVAQKHNPWAGAPYANKTLRFYRNLFGGQTVRRHSAGGDRAGLARALPRAESLMSRSSGGRTPGARVIQVIRSVMGADVSGVRLHTDGAAAEAASSLNAEAFTVGKRVYFGAGRYAPESSSGVGLLMHELAHTWQPDGGGASTPGSTLRLGSASSASERSADRAASTLSRAMRPGRGAAPAAPPRSWTRAATGQTLRRKEKPGVGTTQSEPKKVDPEAVKKATALQKRVNLARPYNLKGHSVSMLVKVRKMLVKHGYLTGDAAALDQTDVTPETIVNDDFVKAVMAFQTKALGEKLTGDALEKAADGQIGPGTFKLLQAHGLKYTKSGGTESATVTGKDGKDGKTSARQIVGKDAPQKAVYSHFRQLVIDNGGLFWDKPGHINVVGVRGANYDQKTGTVSQTKNTLNKWNDTVLVLWTDAEGKKHVKTYSGTTDPGVATAGVATLPEGTYAYKMGQHKGYKALNPQYESVTPAFRDGTSYLGTEGPLGTKGAAGINIHTTHGGEGQRLSGGWKRGDLTGPGSYSTGCTVIDGTDQYADFMGHVTTATSSKAKKGAGQKTVYYTVISSGRVGSVKVATQAKTSAR